MLKWWLARGSWVSGDEKQLTTSWGPEFSYDQITEIDKTKWERKGITRIHYQNGDRSTTFAFDDFKFLREPMGQILRSIENTLKDDQIRGGDREADPDEAVDDPVAKPVAD